MQTYEKTLVTRMPAVAMVTINKPVRERLAWQVDAGFADDLLLSPQRVHIADVELNRTREDDTVRISVKVENLAQNQMKDMRLRAVIQDDFGMILNDSEGRMVVRLDELAAGETDAIELKWQGSHQGEPYHLLLVVEDASGNLQDTIAGQFKLS